MAWARIDDNLALHPKILQAGNAALGLWVRAMSYSCQQLTDGFISDAIANLLGNDEEIVSLVNSGLWQCCEGGYLFHDWGDYQPSREKVLADREAARLRMAALRSGSGEKPSSGNVRANNERTSTEVQRPHPIPSHPTTSKEVDISKNSSTKKSTSNSQNVHSDDFEKFWNAYPRKAARQNALKAWHEVFKKSDVSVDEIISAAKRYRDDPNRSDQFTKYPATWLNGGCWSDDPLPGEKTLVRNGVAGISDWSNYCPDHWQLLGQCYKCDPSLEVESLESAPA